MKVEKIIIMQEVECFRLLTEYHSFLLKFKKGTIEVKLLEFPSPYGVSFILIFKSSFVYFISFIVSVSLRSIIHSYPMVKKVFYCNIFLKCYRAIFLFLKFLCLFQLKTSLTPHFLDIIQLLSFF